MTAPTCSCESPILDLEGGDVWCQCGHPARDDLGGDDDMARVVYRAKLNKLRDSLVPPKNDLAAREIYAAMLHRIEGLTFEEIAQRMGVTTRTVSRYMNPRQRVHAVELCRMWRAKNADRRREINARWREKNRDKERARKRRWMAANREHNRKYQRDWARKRRADRRVAA